MNLWLATDLDDTWVRTARKIGQGVFFNVMGDAVSYEPTFISAKDLAWWDALKRGGVRVVPVTGRSVESCAAWTLHGQKVWTTGGVFSHGASMLSPEGEPVMDWNLQVTTFIDAKKPQLTQWGAHVQQVIDVLAQGVLRLVPLSANGVDFGWVIKAKNEAAEDVLKKLKGDFASNAERLGLTWFAQRNHLTVLPPGLSKASALAFWKEKFASPNDVWIGAGDSIKDGEFMSMCDWQMSPAASEWSKERA